MTNIWTVQSGYDLGNITGFGTVRSSGTFITGKNYVIVSRGTTDFTKIGSSNNNVGTVFTASNSGSTAGPNNTPGTGTASETWINERSTINKSLPVITNVNWQPSLLNNVHNYDINDIVFYEGFYYICTVSHTSGSTFDPSFWFKIKFSKISGNLPTGLRLENYKIVGSPVEVKQTTTSTFVIRVQQLYTKTDNTTVLQSIDRTFTLTIEGPDEPIWVTNSGFLPVGSNNLTFILDNSYVNYHLSAIDTDLSAGDNLLFYLDEKNGTLPPGLTLSSDGWISGIVESILSLEAVPCNGFFDICAWDSGLFDLGIQATIGYDHYSYETIGYDYSEIARVPRKLNRTYEFIVSVTDKITVVKRQFYIFVVGEDYLSVDNSLMKVSTNVFTADNTYFRSVAGYWTTPKFLGVKRSNNFVTLFLDAVDPVPYTGPLVYQLAPFDIVKANCEITLNSPIIKLSNEVVDIRDGMLVTSDGIPSEVPTFVKNVSVGNVNTIVTLTQNAAKTGIITASFTFSIVKNNCVLTLNSNEIIIPEKATDLEIGMVVSGKGIPTANNVYIKSLTIGTNSTSVILTKQATSWGIFPITFTNQTKLPPGIELDESTGELFGYVPYQPAITNEYLFTINAVKYDARTITQAVITIFVREDAPLGSTTLKVIVTDSGDLDLLIDEYIRIGSNITHIYKIISYEDDPTGFSENHKVITLNKSLMANIARLTEITKNVIVTGDTSPVSISPRLFSLKIIGEVDNTIRWVTPFDLGYINANFNSLLKVEAQSDVPNANLIYTIDEGELPSGLTLLPNGEIAGKVQQYENELIKGITYFDLATSSFDDNLTSFDQTLTRFDRSPTTFDNNTASFDRSFIFTVTARDQYNYSSITGTFKLTVVSLDKTVYSNIYVKAFLSRDQRDKYSSFVNHIHVFDPKKVYRYGDPNFGVQQEIKMLIYPGIETVNLDDYLSALQRNVTRRRYKFGDLKLAYARYQGSTSNVYEVIYFEAIDDHEISNNITSATQEEIILTVNQTAYVGQKTLSVTISQYTNLDQLIGEYIRFENDLTQKFKFTSYTSSLLSENHKIITLDRELTDTVLPGTRIIKNIRLSSNNSVPSALNINGVLYYPSSVTNIRNNFSNVMIDEELTTRKINSDNAYLPLWMQTPQPQNFEDPLSPITSATGFIKAVPLCYCKPGQGKYLLTSILNYINNPDNNFSFLQFDFDVDRFIIDSSLGRDYEQYLEFEYRTGDAKYNI